MSIVSRLQRIIEQELKVGDLVRAVVVIAPLGAAYFISGDDAVSDLCLIAISLLVPALKLQLSPKLIALHLLAILVIFAALFSAAPIGPLFVLLAAATAFLATALTGYGEDLRTVGSWTFIPALYVACKLHENAPSAEIFAQASTILAFAPAVLALVYALRVDDGRGFRSRTSSSFGPASSDWVLCASASALAVFAAAALVEIFNLAQGQWLIWSAASVVVGDLTASTNKLKLRAIGAAVGVPSGFLAGLCLPPSRVGYSLALVGALLTLVSFNRYVVGFGLRCFFIVLAGILAGSGSGIPEERITNVLIGGAFGIIAVALVDLASKRLAERGAGRSEVDRQGSSQGTGRCIRSGAPAPERGKGRS